MLRYLEDHSGGATCPAAPAPRCGAADAVETLSGWSGNPPAGCDVVEPGADPQQLASWCSRVGVPAEASGLSASLFAAFIADLVRAGKSERHIRQWCDLMRSRSPGPSPAQLAAIERRARYSIGTRTAVLVVSDDAVMRLGLTGVLREHGVLAWHDTPATAEPSTGRSWDYVLVWLPSRRGIDPFGTIDWISTMTMSGATIVAVYPTGINEIVRLRLAESGARYALPQWWMAERISELPNMLATAALPARFHLETPLALRQQVGLLLNGQLRPLLDLARRCPPRLWTDSGSRTEDWLTRAEVQRIRRVALDQAGVPPPPFSKYATSVRQAPSTPEWREVRRIVRLAFNLSA